MEVRYYEETDSVALVSPGKYQRGSGDALRDYFNIFVAYASPESNDVVDLDIFGVSNYLPLRAERGYDSATDTLTLGDKPNTAGRRVVDSGDFVSHWQWSDDEGQWDIVAVDLRQASRHLAPVIAAQPAQPLTPNPRRPWTIGPSDNGISGKPQ